MNRTCDVCGKEIPAELPMDNVRVGEQYLCKDCGNKFIKGVFGSGFSSIIEEFKNINNISDISGQGA